jgi:hypothetical protein
MSDRKMTVDRSNVRRRRVRRCAFGWILCVLVVSPMLWRGPESVMAKGIHGAAYGARPPSTAQLLKTIIISALKVQVNHPNLQHDDEFVNHLHDTTHLILVLGSLNSHQSLETLVSLSSYAIPEADAGIYDCVLINKGKAIQPLLEKALASQHANECVEKLGTANVTGASPGVSLGKAMMCLNDATQRQVLENALHSIAAGKVCDVNRIQW